MKYVPTVDVRVKRVLKTACCQLCFFETLALKTTLFSEKLFKKLLKVLIQLFLGKKSNQNKMSYFISLHDGWSFHLNLIPKEKHVAVFAACIFSLPFPSVKRREKKCRKTRNTHTCKMQENTRVFFLMILVSSKIKVKRIIYFFSCFLSSKRRNKYVKILISHFLRLLHC